MLQKSLNGLSMSLFITLFCYFLLVHGNVYGKNYNEEEGRSYLKKINADIQVKTTESVLASWAYESNITDENLRHQLDVSAKLANYTKDIWKETIKYPWKTFKDPDVRRQFQKFSVLGTAILSPPKYERFNKIISDMQSVYGKAKICNYRNRTDCSLQLEPELTEIFVKSRDPDELRYYWEQWRDVAGKPVRKMYKEYVDLSNEAAVLNNFTDNAEFWLKDYEAKDFKQQVEDLWEQLRPLYLQLHAYVRRRLREQYGEKHVTKKGPIPAHLLGNMWAQSWGNIFDFTAPYPGKPSMDVTPNMVEQEYTPLRMFKLAEEFFTSLNLSPMPDTFWKNSILEKPKDGRDLICHASAWDFYDGKDFRIKQCTRVTFRQLVTVHHEMGHIQYYLQYKNQPKIYKRGANPGFHEAVGDVMALSVSTPKHLRKIGLLNATEDDSESEINQLFSMALDKIAFLPFGYLMDQWRWSVFEGKTTERDYNCKWWQLREKYQGLSPSVIRTEDDFDPGAKYHTVGNVPYIRYFVSFVIQFQFHRSLCIAAKEYDPTDPVGKPLHKCDIYQSKEAGALLKKMLQMGSSKPWPDAMEVMTGQRKMDAQALLEYFATLKNWLEKENKKTGEFIGWESSRKECNWEDNDETESARSLKTQGNFEDDNIAYSYAEFVRQDDNTFGFPDYLEEIQPSYHGFRHRLKKKEFQANYFLPKQKSRKFSVTNNLCVTPSRCLQDQQKFLEVPRSKRLDDGLERDPVEAQSQKYSTPNGYKVINVPINISFNKKKKKRRENEKNKLMNEIIQRIQNIEDNKITSNSFLPEKNTYKSISARNDLNEKKKLEKISGNEPLDNVQDESESLNEKVDKSKLENKEDFQNQKYSNQKSDTSALDDSNKSIEYKMEAYSEKMKADEGAGYSSNYENQPQAQNVEKKSQVQNSENRSQSQNSEKRFQNQNSENRFQSQNSENRFQSQNSENRFQSQNSENRYQPQNTENRYQPLNADNRYQTQNADNRYQTQNAENRYQSQNTENRFQAQNSDNRFQVQNTENRVQAQNPDNRVEAQNRMEVQNTENKGEGQSAVENGETKYEVQNAERKSESENAERKSEMLNAEKKIDLENAAARARNELLWKAELVKTEAERMLKNYNISLRSSDSQNSESISKSSLASNFLKPNSHAAVHTTAPDNIKRRNILPLYNTPENFKQRKSDSIFNPLENFSKNADFINLKNNEQHTKHHLKEYDLVSVIPVDNLYDKRQYETKSTNQKRNAQTSDNSDSSYVLLVSKISEKQKHNLNLKRRKKKSYKEYHYNVKTPVLYNAVVITPGGKPEKPDESKEHWAKLNKRGTRILEFENNLRGSKSRRYRRSHDFLVNRLPSFVKNNNFNIKNIVQYFGCLQLLL